MRIVPALSLSLLLAASVGLQTVSAEPSGSIIDLGTLGGTRTTPFAVNDLGVVVGGSNLVGDLVQSPLIRSNGTMQQLGTLPGHAQGHVRAINNLGQMVGETFPAGLFGILNPRAVLWDSDGIAHDLNTPATAAAGWTVLTLGLGINDAGQIVGEGRRGTLQHAFQLDNGAITDLGTLGGPGSFAIGINRFGQIAGAAEGSDGLSHPVIWTNGIIRDLGGNGWANALNDFGEATGFLFSATGYRPVFWDASGTPVLLPLLDPAAIVFGINNLQQMAGAGNTAGGLAVRAVVWQDGSPIDLETLISTGDELTAAYGINNAGQVIGQKASGRGFLIQLPVPASGVVALIDSLVADAGMAASLQAKITGAAGNPIAECNQLKSVANEIGAQSGKKIPAEIAADLLENIEVARTGC
jgi:probable HAF family extracellular repeat protein